MTTMLRFMGDGADLADEALPEGITDHDVVAIFKNIVLLRTFDERAVALQRQGRIGTYPPFSGEEATQAGPHYACKDTDWLWPSYRQNAIGILRGVPASTPLKYRRGFGGRHGFWNPREHRVAPICIPIGTHLPHAVGLAWAAKMRGHDVASLVWFGDGATSEGDFHEAMNFAAVFKVPTVFFCVNNQWAISTPVARQMATKTIAEKAAAYGMPGVRIDGFDPIACWKATADALARGRAGKGPSLVEAFCYRLGPHATADDPNLYRDKEEQERWRPLEPVGRTAAFLRRRGALTESDEKGIRAQAAEIVAEAVTEMEAVERPGAEVLFDYVYRSGRPWTLEQGAADLAGP
jgi:pyruvate dehydrogenase E1 component alpha subunit